MSKPTMLVGLGATRAAWSSELRAYVRNHLTGMSAEAVLDTRQLRRTGRRPLDALILDDVTRIFRPPDVAEVVAAGTVVIGLFDPERGLGRRYLEDLGVTRVLPVSTPVADLAAELAEIGPINAASVPGRPESVPAVSRGGRRGVLSVWSAVSGGAGLSEAVLAAATMLAERSRVLLIEANPMTATLATRTGRDPAFGLAWTLGRIGQGHRGLPEGLSPPRADDGRSLGAFDTICQTAAPGGPPLLNPGELLLLVNEARAAYEQVVLEVGPVLSPSSLGGLDRFAAGRTMLGEADRVVVLAGPDPESAARLVEWGAAATEWGVTAPLTAVFARIAGRGRFEGSHLRDLLDRSTGGAFAAVHVLPEDAVVARARWNGELVWRGRWRAALGRLVDELAATPLPVSASAGPPRRMSLASEVGLS